MPHTKKIIIVLTLLCRVATAQNWLSGTRPMIVAPSPVFDIHCFLSQTLALSDLSIRPGRQQASVGVSWHRTLTILRSFVLAGVAAGSMTSVLYGQGTTAAETRISIVQTLDGFFDILSTYSIYRIAFDTVRPSWIPVYDWLKVLAGAPDSAKLRRSARRFQVMIDWLDKFNSTIDVLIVRMLTPYFNVARWEYRGVIYRRLGVDRFRRLFLSIIPLARSPFLFYNIGRDPVRMMIRTRYFELVHLQVVWLMASFGLLLYRAKLNGTFSQWPAALFVFSVIGIINFYLILQQRFNRARLERIIHEAPNLLPRLMAPAADSGPAQWKLFARQSFAIFLGFNIGPIVVVSIVALAAKLIGIASGPIISHPLFLMVRIGAPLAGAHAALKIHEIILTRQNTQASA